MNKLLNVYGHLELVLDDLDQLLRVDEALLVGETTHGHVGIDGVLVIGCGLIFLLFRNDMLELGVGNFSSVFCISLSNHSENFFLGGLLAHHFEHNSQLIGVDLARTVLVEGTEGFPALGFLLLGETFLFFV